MLIKVFRFAAIIFAAFSLCLSMTHLLELPQRMKFDQELWVRVTVFENLYALFGSVGSVFEIGAILIAFILTFLVRGRGQTFYWSLGGAVILLAAFASWVIFVADANAELAQWLTNPVPPDWQRTRDQWEYAHAVNAFFKIAGLSLLVISVLVETSETKAGNSKQDV